MSVMILHKLQQKWQEPADNNILQRHPDAEQMKRIYDFSTQYHYYFEKFKETIDCLQNSASTFKIIDKCDQIQPMINNIVEQGWVIVQLLNESHSSYKGYLSWIMLTTGNQLYLIDSAELHNKLHCLSKIFENQQILKFCLHSQQFNYLKRDFSIFSVNIFDLSTLIPWYEYSTTTMFSLSKIFTSRPFSKTFQKQLKKQLDLIWKFINEIQWYIETKSEYLHQAFYQCNSYQYLLTPYIYIEQYLQDKENLSDEQGKLLNLLLAWRNHTAKILDLSTQAVIPLKILYQLVHLKARSIIQISQIMTSNKHQLSMDHYSKILQVIICAEQEHYSYFEFPRKSKNKDDNKVRNLLVEIGWDDKDWLNRKNDESIKLYKQIISIDELDDSIAQQYIQSVSEKVIKKYEIARYIKYAQFLRNGNFTRLKDFYNLYLEEKQQNDEQWYHNQMQQEDQNEQFTCFKSQEQLPKNYKENKQKNITSMETICSKPQINFVSNRIQSRYFIDYEKQNNRKNIKNLPENIEQIYLMAATLKKNHDRTNKNNKKVNKTEKKQEQFVPTKEQLMNILDL